MTQPLHIALTADLHWRSRHFEGDTATEQMIAALTQTPPDLLIVAGDIGTEDQFDECLGLFDGLTCRKALVPGNHDVWVAAEDSRGDSLTVYREHLPAVSARRGFHYLDAGPLLFPESDLAVLGSMNWYDYSWSIDRLKTELPDWEKRLREKRFTRGRHNDGRFVRWPLDDVSFTAEVVAKLAADLDAALAQVGRAIVVTHHPPWYGLNYPGDPNTTPSVDQLMWEAFSGNRAMEELLAGHGERIPFVFCGHTHFAREATLGASRGYNIGGDYHFKRLLRLEWPTGTVTAEVFGKP
jgi:3',5'-cyclic AMP phosphodiesterase CpdA